MYMVSSRHITGCEPINGGAMDATKQYCLQAVKVGARSCCRNRSVIEGQLLLTQSFVRWEASSVSASETTAVVRTRRCKSDDIREQHLTSYRFRLLRCEARQNVSCRKAVPFLLELLRLLLISHLPVLFCVQRYQFLTLDISASVYDCLLDYGGYIPLH